MQIIFNRQTADQLRERYTVLELETFDVEGQLLETFCVVPAEKMNLGDIPNLETDIRLHETFIEQYKLKNYKFCLDAMEQLTGKFGGELDSFYITIRDKIK